MKTLALGRLPRATGQGIRFQVGSIGSLAPNVPGSFPVSLNTIREVSFRSIKAGHAGTHFVTHIGSSKTGYVYYQIWTYGTTGAPYPGSARSVPVSYLVWGE